MDSVHHKGTYKKVNDQSVLKNNGSNHVPIYAGFDNDNDGIDTYGYEQGKALRTYNQNI